MSEASALIIEVGIRPHLLQGDAAAHFDIEGARREFAQGLFAIIRILDPAPFSSDNENPVFPCH
jgi:hypothetical protein